MWTEPICFEVIYFSPIPLPSRQFLSPKTCSACLSSSLMRHAPYAILLSLIDEQAVLLLHSSQKTAKFNCMSTTSVCSQKPRRPSAPNRPDEVTVDTGRKGASLSFASSRTLFSFPALGLLLAGQHSPHRSSRYQDQGRQQEYKGFKMIEKDQLVGLAKEINAVEHDERSALTQDQDGLKNVFDRAIYVT